MSKSTDNTDNTSTTSTSTLKGKTPETAQTNKLQELYNIYISRPETLNLNGLQVGVINRYVSEFDLKRASTPDSLIAKQFLYFLLGEAQNNFGTLAESDPVESSEEEQEWLDEAINSAINNLMRDIAARPRAFKLDDNQLLTNNVEGVVKAVILGVSTQEALDQLNKNNTYIYTIASVLKQALTILNKPINTNNEGNLLYTFKSIANHYIDQQEGADRKGGDKNFDIGSFIKDFENTDITSLNKIGTNNNDVSNMSFNSSAIGHQLPLDTSSPSMTLDGRLIPQGSHASVMPDTASTGIRNQYEGIRSSSILTGNFVQPNVSGIIGLPIVPTTNPIVIEGAGETPDTNDFPQ